MHKTMVVPDRANFLIQQQAGVITTRQLLGFGLTHRALQRSTKPWTSLTRGLHLVGAPTWEAAAWAGVVVSEEQGGVLSGTAACYLHGAVRDAPRRITVWATAQKTDFDVGPWQVRFRRGDRPSRGTPARAPLETALLDLAGENRDLETIAAVSRALAQGLTTPSRILASLDERSRTRHSHVIRELCASTGIESVLEWLFLRDVLRPHGLPEPRRQVSTEAGRVDCLYEDYDVVMELDGLRDHQDGSRDMFRDNEHVLAGRKALRFGFNAVAFDRCRAARQVARALTKAGWKGRPTRCGPDRKQGYQPCSVDSRDLEPAYTQKIA